MFLHPIYQGSSAPIPEIANYCLPVIKILVFDGKPPENKQLCIQGRKDKSQKAKESYNQTENEEEKQKLEKASTRITKEMIDDIKHLLNLLGVPYIHPEVGEGEAFGKVGFFCI